jgi:hypothetical protein
MGLFGREEDEATKLAKQAEKEQARQAKQEAKQERAHAKAMTVKFREATYLGGLPDQKKIWSGDLVFNESTISLSKVLIPMSDVASVGIGSEPVSETRAVLTKTGAVLAFGVLGHLATKDLAERGDIVVHLKSGNKAHFHVAKMDAVGISSALSPVLRELGIPSRRFRQYRPPRL